MEKHTDLNNMINLMADIESGNVDKYVGTYGKVTNNEVAGMQQAIDALMLAEAKSQEKQPTIEDDLDLEMSSPEGIYSGSSFSITENKDGSFKLSSGNLCIINSCVVKEGLNKLKSVLESGVGVESPEALSIIKNIGVANYSNRKINEAKAKYKTFKDTNNVSGMNEQKKIYNESKQQLSNSLKYLSE